MAVQAERRLFSVADYHKMAEAGILKPTDRVELIHGEIVKMSPINSQHAGHVLRINVLLNKLLADIAFVNIQNPVQIDEFSEPEPDIAILKPSVHFYTQHHPQPADVYFLIEVADSSLQYDRETKLPLYAQAGIPEVWIINLKKRCIEIYQIPQDNRYKINNLAYPDDTIELPFPGISVQGSDFLG